jgi:secondary thiamine-phosphate synthase enzyme
MPTTSIRTSSRNELVDVTERVVELTRELGLTDGAVLVSSPHTTAAITINEGYDPDVAGDLLRRLERLAPHGGDDRHDEGNSDSHLKVALVGSSQLVPVEGGELALGRWQRIFFCEFDGPRTRELRVGRVT